MRTGMRDEGGRGSLGGGRRGDFWTTRSWQYHRRHLPGLCRRGQRVLRTPGAREARVPHQGEYEMTRRNAARTKRTLDVVKGGQGGRAGLGRASGWSSFSLCNYHDLLDTALLLSAQSRRVVTTESSGEEAFKRKEAQELTRA